MKHKFLSLFIATVAMTILNSPTFASVTIDGIAYELNGTTATVVGGGNYTGTIVIPESVTYSGTTYSVTSIGDRAFDGCSGLTSVTIPNSVTSIGEDAFTGCSGLTSVTIPNSVTSIGDGAFYKCSSLTSVTIGNSVTSIGSSAFSGCSGLTSVTIPNSVTSIEGWAFRYCSGLTSVTIGNSVTSIGERAFYHCSSLTSVTIPNSVTSIGYGAFYNCSGLTSVTIPNSVTSIGGGAFYGCSGLTTVTIPNSVTSIGSETFRDCSGLTSVEIPNSVTSIGQFAFCNCSSLTSVTIPNSVTSIGEGAFYGCTGLTSVTIPNSVTSIGNYAFDNVANIIYDGEATGSPWGAKYFNGYTEGYFTFTDNTKTMLVACSTNAKGNLTIPNSVTSIGNNAFKGCSGLTTVTIPNSVTSIGDRAFYGCSGLTTVTIGNGVTSIVYETFRDCSSLISVTIPNSVTSIGSSAFKGCSGLTSVTLNSNTIVGKDYEYDSNIKSIFGEQVTEYILGDEITSIGENAFSECTGLTSVTIPNSVTSIGDYAFYGCSGLTSVTIPNSVTSIGYGAFAYCSSLTSVTIPNSVTSIGAYAFYECSGLTSVTIPNSVTSIGEGAFESCSSLTSIYVPCGEMERFKQMLNNDSRINEHAPLPYTITISATNGNVIYPQTICDDMLLNATPDYGYHFVKWSDGNTDNPREFVLTQDTTFAAEFAVDKSGVCGDDNLLTWTFEDESKTLAISGEGTLNSNYTFGVEAPTQTERLIIAEGVTSVGNNAFKDMSSTITSLALPSTVTEIGDYAFAGMNNRKFNTLVLPNTIIRIGAHAFDGASYLQTIHFGSTLEEIGNYAFNGCTRVKQMTCLAEITPNVGTDGLTSINSLAELYVPNEYLFDYQIDNNWSRFVLKPYGATETTVTDNDVTVVADDNTATFTWPTSNTADSYTIDITKDGVLFCQLTFNANGQLTGIAFAPGRGGQSMAPAATLTTSGMQFTVTGLNSGTNYAFNLTVKSGSTVVASYTGAFATTGGVPTSTDVLQSDLAPRKFIRDNQVLIMRGGKTYTIQGVEVQ